MKKFLLISAVLAIACAAAHAQTEKVWCLVTNSGEQVPVTDVGYIVGGDASDVLTIIFRDAKGSISGVTNFSFSREYATGISTARSEDSEPVVEALRKLDFSMLPEGTPVEVYAPDGKLMLRASAPQVNVASLRAGTYIIRVKGTSIKLQKK